MKAWNKKRKPKHYTKPKWKSRAIKTSLIRSYTLVSRQMKNKFRGVSHYLGFYKNKPNLFKIFRREPKFKILARNRKYK